MLKNLSALFLLISFLAPATAEARSRKKNSVVSIAARSIEYNDLQSSSADSSTKVKLEKVTEFELGFRFHSLYQLLVLKGDDEEDTRNYFGAALRIDTMGPFWLGRNAYRAVRNKTRSYPFNTSFFAAIHSTTLTKANGTEEEVTETNFGLTLDIFLFNPYVFLTGQVSVLHSQGNAFTSHSAGLGIEF